MLQLKPSIANISNLNFVDWQLIANSSDNSKTWAFFKWLENADKAQLEAISRTEIKEIAEIIGYSSGYVADKIDEYC